MKNNLYIILLSVIMIGNFQTAFCQTDDQLEKEFATLFKDNSDSASLEGFIQREFFKTYNLAGADTMNSRIQVWSATGEVKDAFKQVYDIRWKFDSQEEATKFYKKFMPIISENSEEIKKPNIKIKESDELIFFEDIRTEEIMKGFGLTSSNFVILMVVNNYVIKLYFSASDTIRIDDTKSFAAEAAARTHAVSK